MPDEAACLGLAEIFGITAKDDLLLPDEELIWEWKLLAAAFGHRLRGILLVWNVDIS